LCIVSALTVHALEFDLNMQVTVKRQHKFLGLTLDSNDRTYAGPRQIACLLSRRGFIFNPKGESFENGDYGNHGERQARKRPFTFGTQRNFSYIGLFVADQTLRVYQRLRRTISGARDLSDWNRVQSGPPTSIEKRHLQNFNRNFPTRLMSCSLLPSYLNVGNLKR